MVFILFGQVYFEVDFLFESAEWRNFILMTLEAQHKKN